MGPGAGARRRLDQTWLLFTPRTWTERTAEMARVSRERSGQRPRDPASSWVAERWARRRRNEAWAAILAAWSEALAPRSGSCLVHALPRALSEAPGAVGGSFALGNITAYSRKATAAT